jgi:hypothetical protein
MIIRAGLLFGLIEAEMAQVTTKETIWSMKAAEEICSNASTKAVRAITG